MYVTPMPKLRHQWISVNLTGALLARYTERLPVRLGSRDYGEIDLSSIFPPV